MNADVVAVLQRCLQRYFCFLVELLGISDYSELVIPVNKAGFAERKGCCFLLAGIKLNGSRADRNPALAQNTELQGVGKIPVVPDLGLSL